MASCIFQVISNQLMLILLFSCSGHSQEPDLDCIPSLRVPRNTVWKSPEKQTLKINCTVITESHCWKILSVSWCKIEDDNNHCRPLSHSTHTVTEWRNITENKRMFFLLFWSLSLQDAGLYRCEADAPVFTASHTINVTVTAPVTDVDVISNKNRTTTVNLNSEVLDNKNKIYIRDTEQSVVKQFYLIFSTVIVVTLVLTIMVLFKTINNKDSEPSLQDKDLLTTVCYGAAEESSLQD